MIAGFFFLSSINTSHIVWRLQYYFSPMSQNLICWSFAFVQALRCRYPLWCHRLIFAANSLCLDGFNDSLLVDWADAVFHVATTAISLPSTIAQYPNQRHAYFHLGRLHGHHTSSDIPVICKAVAINDGGQIVQLVVGTPYPSHTEPLCHRHLPTMV